MLPLLSAYYKINADLELGVTGRAGPSGNSTPASERSSPRSGSSSPFYSIYNLFVSQSESPKEAAVDPLIFLDWMHDVHTYYEEYETRGELTGNDKAKFDYVKSCWQWGVSCVQGTIENSCPEIDGIVLSPRVKAIADKGRRLNSIKENCGSEALRASLVEAVNNYLKQPMRPPPFKKKFVELLKDQLESYETNVVGVEAARKSIIDGLRRIESQVKKSNIDKAKEAGGNQGAVCVSYMDHHPLEGIKSTRVKDLYNRSMILLQCDGARLGPNVNKTLSG